MVTVNEQKFVAPQAFVAWQVTGFTPFEKQVPDGGEQLTNVPPVTWGGRKCTRAQEFESHETNHLATMFEGQVMTGSGGAITVTVKLHEARISGPRVAVQVTVVVPAGKGDPLGGVQVTITFDPHKGPGAGVG